MHAQPARLQHGLERAVAAPAHGAKRRGEHLHARLQHGLERAVAASYADDLAVACGGEGAPW
jgi:hypothetical protein